MPSLWLNTKLYHVPFNTLVVYRARLGISSTFSYPVAELVYKLSLQHADHANCFGRTESNVQSEPEQLDGLFGIDLRRPEATKHACAGL
jgi:hypothetical protein